VNATIETWCGSKAPLEKAQAVILGWKRHCRRLKRENARLRRPPRLKRKPMTLEFQLCEILSSHCGERGHTEGAVDTLCRLVSERDRAMTALALDRLSQIPL